MSKISEADTADAVLAEISMRSSADFASCVFSGGILLLHLLKSLKINGGGKGILSIAGAGGMGQAIAIESV